MTKYLENALNVNKNKIISSANITIFAFLFYFSLFKY